tara:strand:- start:10943 stop:11131 length:189 start_codon:yes stop_codon:yes gene_type:complete
VSCRYNRIKLKILIKYICQKNITEEEIKEVEERIKETNEEKIKEVEEKDKEEGVEVVRVVEL